MAEVVAASEVVWKWACFGDLGVAELYAIVRARTAVFIVEQACPYQDTDDLDGACHHLWTLDAQGSIAAYLRVVPPGISYPEPALGRVITSSRARGTGLGHALVAEGIRRVEALYGVTPIRIGAQRYLLSFYQKLGFVPTGYDYDEDGIPHSEMLRLGM